MALSSSPGAFLEFDRKTGFQVGAQQPAPLQAARIRRTLRLSLFEAAFGCVKRVAAMEQVPCTRCLGSGSWQAGTCQACQGRGRTDRRAWEVDVTVHAGTLDGSEIAPQDVQPVSSVRRVARRFAFTVHIEPHPLFRLDRDRLSITVPISIWRWVQGGSITVPTLQGSASVNLPRRPAAMLVPQHGWPEPGSVRRRKPLYVLPRLVFPEALRHEERRMLELLEIRSNMPEVKAWGHHLKAWLESASTDFD